MTDNLATFDHCLDPGSIELSHELPLGQSKTTLPSVTDRARSSVLGLSIREIHIPHDDARPL